MYEVPTGATRQAVEFLTLWMEPGLEPRQAAAKHIMSVTGHDLNGEWVRTVSGLLNLGMFLVLQLARERGATTDEELSNGAQAILSELSIKLPEW